MKKVLKISSIVVLVLSIIGFVALWILLPVIILQPQRLDIKQQPALLHHKINPADYGLVGEDISFTTSDSVYISATFLSSENQPAKATIIMLHGIGACKETFLPTAAAFCKNSINVVLMDNRAHGQSGGTYCTYGFHEKDDVSVLVTKLLERDPTNPIGLYGASLGGAISYQVIGQDHRIRFAIIESTFDDLKNVVREYLARFIGFHFDALADFALWRATQVAGFESGQVIPSHSAKNATCPVFCAHGTRDIHIPLKYGIHNYAQLQSKGSEFHLISNADHNNVSSTGGPLYRKMMLHFIRENSKD